MSLIGTFSGNVDQICIAFDEKCTEHNMCRSFCSVRQLKILCTKNSSHIYIYWIQMKAILQVQVQSEPEMGNAETIMFLLLLKVF